MYYVKKTFEISASHRLELDYESKCRNVHGHNWIICVKCQSDKLNKNGMVYDFTHIKKKIQNRLDHQNLNALFDFNPTAENMARWIADELGETCVSVSVTESEGNEAVYER